IHPGVSAMEGPTPVLPLAPSPEPSPFADPADLLALFRQMFPAEAAKAFDSGHAGVFDSSLVIWLMVWQRSQGNASMAEAVAEMLLGPTSEHLPPCKRVRDRDISP